MTNAVAIAAGFDDCLALRRDGTIVSNQAQAPALTNVLAISDRWFHWLALVGDSHGIGLDSEGSG